MSLDLEYRPLPILNCDDCGICCHLQGGPPFGMVWPPTPGQPPRLEWEVLPIELRERYADQIADDPNGWRRHEIGLSCYWFDEATKRCRHYEHRPRACVDFELGGEECRDLRGLNGLD